MEQAALQAKRPVNFLDAVDEFWQLVADWGRGEAPDLDTARETFTLAEQTLTDLQREIARARVHAIRDFQLRHPRNELIGIPTPDDLPAWTKVLPPPKRAQAQASKAPPDPAPSALPLFRLGKFWETPVINRKEQEILTEGQFDVLFVIRNAGSAGIKLRDLIDKSKHTGARKIVYDLLEQQPAWRTQVEPAGRRGRPYRWIGNVEAEWTPRIHEGT
jgi:hypothetical protein